MRSIAINLLFLLLFVVPNSAWAQVLHGPEFRFIHDEMNAITDSNGSEDHVIERKFAKILSDALIEKCKELNENCTSKEVDGRFGKNWKFTIYYPEGPGFYSVQVGWNPKCVEVTMDPMTLPQMYKVGKSVEAFLFDNAKSVGLITAQEMAGHYNMGFETVFQADPELFLRFFVDHANHPEWDLGVLGYDIENAPPLSILRKSQRTALEEIVKRFYRGEYKSAYEIAKDITLTVYTRTSEWNSRGEDNGHYQAINLETIAGHFLVGRLSPRYDHVEVDEPEEISKQRVEMRGIYGQPTFEHFVRISEFFEARIQLLKKHQAAGIPISLRIPKRDSFTWSERKFLFQQELRRMGLDYEKFKILLTPDIRNAEVSCSEFMKKI